MFLRLEALIVVQWHITARPLLDDRPRTGNTVRQMPDRKRVFVGIVVAFQNVEIAQHQEGGPLGAAGKLQHRLRAVICEWAAVGTLDAHLLEIPNRVAILVGELGIEALWKCNLIAPGLAAHPSVLAQQVGRRGKGIRRKVPDIAPPVAVDIDRPGLIAGGDELRMPHGAGP